MKTFFMVLPGGFLGGALTILADLGLSNWEWWLIMVGTFAFVAISDFVERAAK